MSYFPPIFRRFPPTEKYLATTMDCPKTYGDADGTRIDTVGETPAPIVKRFPPLAHLFVLEKERASCICPVRGRLVEVEHTPVQPSRTRSA